MLELKQGELRTGKGKGIGRHLKGIRYFGISGKGKGKRPQKKVTKSKVMPLITKMALENNQLLVSVKGIC